MRGKPRKATALDHEALRMLASGGSVGGGRFDRLQELGLVDCQVRISLHGTTCEREEHVWITEAGKAEIASAGTGADA